jgi:hypothetical protein
MQSAIMGVAQFRVARPTNQLSEIKRFYHQGLGMPLIGSFKDHEGYDGIMLGSPSADFHLEFTTHCEGSPCPAPGKDNLLVLYFDTKAAHQRVIDQMLDQGYLPVVPENPYWEGKSVTFEDPDGWRVVLFDGLFDPSPTGV